MTAPKVEDFDSYVAIHLDAEGHVVEPFMALDDEKDRDERQRVWYESIALDLEEECLIK